jgi:hypothetical protein
MLRSMLCYVMLCYATYAVQFKLCTLTYAIHATRSIRCDIYYTTCAMQFMLCTRIYTLHNKCYALNAMQSVLCKLSLAISPLLYNRCCSHCYAIYAVNLCFAISAMLCNLYNATMVCILHIAFYYAWPMQVCDATNAVQSLLCSLLYAIYREQLQVYLSNYDLILKPRYMYGLHLVPNYNQDGHLRPLRLTITEMLICAAYHLCGIQPVAFRSSRTRSTGGELAPWPRGASLLRAKPWSSYRAQELISGFAKSAIEVWLFEGLKSWWHGSWVWVLGINMHSGLWFSFMTYIPHLYNFARVSKTTTTANRSRGLF